ncbi:hypothetical protein [Negativicoccus succinicivorans]
MARIAIKRPNGNMEYAELTTDKSLAGYNRLAVVKGGTKYYAKLDTGVSTHMYVLKNGRKLYVQKEVAFQWSFYIAGHDYNFVVPRSGTYKLEYEDYTYYSDGRNDKVKGSEELKLSAGDKPYEQGHGTWTLGGKTIAFEEDYYDRGGWDDIESEGRSPIRITYLHD